MNPLTKEVIDILEKEEDNNLIAEVLDFYEYLKVKKEKEEAVKSNLVKVDECEIEECKNCKHVKVKHNSIFTDCKLATCEKENLLLTLMGRKNCCTYYNKKD
ncbi:MAG: hypothetical protein RSG51_03660 [Bacilli bacterium]